MASLGIHLVRIFGGLILSLNAVASLAAENPGYTYSTVTGKVVNANTGKPVANAIVSASWRLERDGATAAQSIADPSASLRAMIRQARTNELGVYVLPAWTAPVKPPKGWIFNNKKLPNIAVFSAKHEPLTESKFANVLELYPYSQNNNQKEPDDISLDNAEVILWTIRKYIEQETKFYQWVGNEDRVVNSQTLLLVLSDELCQTWATRDASHQSQAPNKRSSPCFEEDSAYGQIQARQRKVKAMVLSASKMPPKKAVADDIVLPVSIPEKAKK